MIWLILLGSFLIRLVGINQSLWLDEAIGAEAVKNFSLWGLMAEFSKFDNHPPLYYMVLKLWTDIFGYSEVSLRFPSIALGVGTVYLTFLIARKLNPKGKIFYLLAPLLLATSGLHIYYSQEARMYSMAAFLAALAVYGFLSSAWLLFSFSITALLMADYVGVFLLPIFWIWGIWKREDKSWWRAFWLTHLPLVVFGMFWLPTFLLQSSHGKWLLETLPAWRAVAGGASVKQAGILWAKFVLGRISFTNKVFYYLLVGLASIPVLVGLLKALRRRKEVEFIWLWLVIPLASGFVVSFIFPAFIYFRFLFTLPAFFILISWGVNSIKSRVLKPLIFGLLLMANLFGWFIYASKPTQQRERWREAVGFVEGRAKNNEVVIFEYPEAFTPWRWYASGKIKAFGATDEISADGPKTKDRTINLTTEAKGVYYFEYLRDLSDPQRVVEKTLAEQGFMAKEIFDYFPGVGQVTYYAKD